MLDAKGRDILASFEEDCKKAGVEYETALAYGIVPNEICSRANLSDIVILGRRGINARFEYGLLGSTTESVLKNPAGARSLVTEPESAACLRRQPGLPRDALRG